ncbi:MAG: thioredoxin family protein [Candidatus Omnitrophica bacterium]|nr:thioredoxin family protein [Candidatus Omnitrophota bacterium]MBU4479755.1 thioredoxin family protein [Candidatus Omnitrophota bacterium]MCG2703278.1 thioredoxin family protein [Candidatus Omnitrophota bacterium]
MQVKVYSTPTCPYCRMTKEYLSAKGITYENIDVSSDPVMAEEMVNISGQMGVPVVVIGETVIVGFDKQRIDSLIK